MRSRALEVALLLAAGCASKAMQPPGPAGQGGAMTEDPLAMFTPEERASLQALALKDAAPPRDATNAFADDARAARLGQRLFFYPGFAGPLLDGDNDGSAETLGNRGDTGRVACASCHVPAAGFLDNRSRGHQISLAAGWGVRRAPSLLDVGQRRLLAWDGRRDAVYNQIFGVIESDREMNSSRLYVAQQVFAHFRADYEALFGRLPPLDDAARFPPLAAAQAGCDPPAPLQPPTCRGRPGDGAVYDHLAPADQQAVTRVVVNLGKALGAYLRLLRCGPGRFDAWLGGDAHALGAAEQRGARLFVGRAGCVRCHGGPFLTDFQFHNVGLRPAVVAIAFIDRDDPGAATGLTQLRQDPLNTKGAFSDGDDQRVPAAVPDSLLGAFETPMLRCAGSRPSFMHTGQLGSLDEVVGFFNVGGDADGYPGQSELKPLGLSPDDRGDLIAFLRTLDGPGPPAALRAPPP